MQNAIHHLRLIRPLLLWLLIWLSIGACTLVGEQIELTPTPTLPTVEFLFPENNAQVFEGTDLTLDIVARDSVGGIGRVELFVDELSDGEPYREVSPDEDGVIDTYRVEMNWLAAGVGRHQFTAKAYRNDGTPSDETTIIVEVIPRE
ncbi:MAG: Ig-like domain-containing protein [Chloroflexota bacterium]